MRRGASRAILAGLVLSTLLAGCVGIPTSGGVETGPVIDAQLPPDFVYVPSGPTPGGEPEELLEDFMLAMRGPQNNYAIARQFLTRNLAGTWDPEESATVRSGIPSVVPGAEPAAFEYTVTTKAVVDTTGRYSETPSALQTFNFGFTQEDGEWRISSAPNGVVLSQASFNTVFAERALYFFDPSFGFLVPDVRWFPARATLPVRIVGALTEGPASWLQQGVVLTAFPIATSVESVAIDARTATVELSDEALGASPQDRDRMRQQLTATLDVASVVMRVGGLTLTTPAPGDAAVKNPSVEGATLIGTGDAFGFDTVDGISPITGLSEKVVAAGASAATLSADKGSIAIVSSAGVSIVRIGDEQAALLDDRADLIAPSIDPFRFVWSVQGASAASLTAFETDGTPHAIAGLPAEASVFSIDVSRDGTRLLVYLSTSVGPRLIVGGIIRQADNVPTALGELLDLPVAAGTPVDATWVDDRTVAIVSRGADIAPVTLVEVGGPSATLGQVADALAIVGGNGGAGGVRVLRNDGGVWRPQGGGWVSTGVKGSFIATKQ